MSNTSKIDRSSLKAQLSPEQYRCTQENGTEKPFENAYWNHHEDGIYVDVVDGTPLFSSLDKYDSGSGWPSFTKPLAARALVERKDSSHGMDRVEVRSSAADSHLGHVFDDGPGPNGLRFCINSASLKFVAVDELAARGLGFLRFLFAKKKGWEVATLAGGCFWGMEELLRTYAGVLETQVGYSGGSESDATYEKVKTGKTGHAESLQILFDPKKLSYEDLLLRFFKMHDPTTKNRQGGDVGSQYRSAIFWHSEEQRKTAEKVIERVNRSGKLPGPVVTEVTPFNAFYRAEDYHQKYLEKKPDGYTCHYVRKIDF